MLSNFFKFSCFGINNEPTNNNVLWNQWMCLDGQYTVFGEVEEGLDVVEMIQNSATGRADRPVDDIEMRMVVVE